MCFDAAPMATRVCRREVVRWVWRWTVCPADASRGRMSFCSAGQERRQSGPPHVSGSGSPLTVGSLLQMGFSRTEAEEMREAALKSRGGRVSSVLTALLGLGLNPSSVLRVLQKCPELYSLTGTEVQQRAGHLRRMGLVEGSLQRVICHHPRVLLLSVKRVNMVSRLLRDKCLFTVQQVTDILRDSPEVLEEDLARLEYKFQYAYFRMGVRQAEMVKAKLFRLALLELRCRHCFLERRGQYQTPDKKGQTLILNPSLKDFLCVSEETYLKNIAMATAEEFRVFCKLMEREQEEEFVNSEEEDDLGEDEDDDDDEKHSRRHNWKTGYKRDRKTKRHSMP